MKSYTNHPGPEEAWMMVPKNEDMSVVWTKEMAEAYFLCKSYIKKNNEDARRAFIEIYSKLLERAVRHGDDDKVTWQISLGHDKYHRHATLFDAVSKGRISEEDAKNVLSEFQI